MISFLCAALVFSLASAEPQSTSSQAALDTETATRLVNGWPGLSPSTGRRLVSVKAGGENAAGVGFIEFRFRDGGASRTAVGFAAPSSAMANNKSKVISEYRGWALARVLEDKTLDDVIEGLRQARTTANEAAALGRLRSVVSGQMAFSTANDLAAVRKKAPGGWQRLCILFVGTRERYELLSDGEIRTRVRDAVVEPRRSLRFPWGIRFFPAPNKPLASFSN